MILTITTMLTVWLLTMTLLAVWCGVLVAVGVMAVTLALILYGIVWLLTCASGIFSQRRREGRFG